MVTKDEYYQIKAYFDIGLSLSAIAKRLNLHSKTVSKILTGGFKEMQRGSKLDKFKDYIKQRLESYPELTSIFFKLYIIIEDAAIMSLQVLHYNRGCRSYATPPLKKSGAF